LGEPEKPKPSDRAKNELDKKLKPELGPAAQREGGQKDPLLDAAKGMRDAQTRLAQGKSDAVTQHVQRQAVADLQKIIDEAKRSGKCCGQPLAGNCKPSGKPGAGAGPKPESTSRAPNEGPAKISNPNAKHDNKAGGGEEKKLAHKALMEQYRIGLPERQREQMSGAPSEYFLPDYEREIEDYFRRLSSGKPEEERPR
jgi:hypothetical protein